MVPPGRQNDTKTHPWDTRGPKSVPKCTQREEQFIAQAVVEQNASGNTGAEICMYKVQQGNGDRTHVLCKTFHCTVDILFKRGRVIQGI